MAINIHAAVRLNGQVYLPGNEDHADELEELLNEKQAKRLTDAGAISEKKKRAPRKKAAKKEEAPADPFKKDE